MTNEPILPQSLETSEDPTLPDRRAAIAHHMAALEELVDPAARTDGWTPFARKLFLQIVAETGRVSMACQVAGLSKQSAYALRARDPLFAIGWDAACQLARTPLADSLYEQAVEGITDTITRADGQTITRHRVDGRLSIAVLNRLDRRCDRAVEAGSRHLGAIGRWDDFVAAIGIDDSAAAQAIIDAHLAAVERAKDESAKVSQPSQLWSGSDEEQDDADLPDPRIWWDMGRKEYRTNFPPPEGHECHEQGPVGGHEYHRSLTPVEAEVMARRDNAEAADRRAADEKERDAFFFAGLGETEDSPAPPPWGRWREATEGSAPEQPLRQLKRTPPPRARGDKSLRPT